MTASIRSAALSNYVDVARQVGLDPFRLVAQTGLPSECLHDSDLRVPARAVLQLLEMSAHLSGEEAFGLRLAETRRLSTLGLVGMLARDEPTVRLALAALLRYSRLHNESLVVEFEEQDGVVVLREELLPSANAGRQSIELAVGAMCRILKILLGSDWSPRLVSFMHPPPRQLAVHHRVLGRRVKFRQDFNGVVLSSDDLETPIAFADPVMTRYARQMLDASPTLEDLSVAGEVRQLILALLPTGRCSIEQVARHWGVDRKTVSRKLKREDTDFSRLLDETRSELTQRYLQYGNRSLTEIAPLLGFSSLSAFARWRRAQSLPVRPRATAALRPRAKA